MTEFTQPFDLVRMAAEKHPKRFALISPKRQLSYAQLVSVGAKLGQVLRRRGVAPGDIIGVQTGSFWRCVVSVAIGHEAAVFVPLSDDLIRDNYLGIKWIIVDKPNPDFPIEQQFVIDREFIKRLASVRVTAAPRRYETGDSLYRIGMSSGTTGRPKAIPLTVTQNHDRALESIARWSTSGRFMSLLFPKNGAGWHAWHTSIVRQETYLVPTVALANVQVMAAVGVESVMGSPSQLAVFAQALAQTKIKLPALRHIQSGGSRLTTGLMDEIRALTGLEIGNTYSSTELGGVAYRVGDSEDPSYMGELVDDVDIEIVDPDTHEPVPAGEFGLMRLRRENMITGYLKNDEANAEQFRDGWFYPGDTAKIVGNGLHLGARESEMINAGGHKIDPNQIDDALRALPEILDAAAFPLTNKLGLQELAIAYVLQPGAVLGDLWDRFNKQFGGAPKQFFPVEVIPRNDWGKVLRRELSERYSVDAEA